jgi:hypothetical protein
MEQPLVKVMDSVTSLQEVVLEGDAGPPHCCSERSGTAPSGSGEILWTRDLWPGGNADLDRGSGPSRTVVDMTPEEMADLAHLRLSLIHI